jgi:PAS domain S-box-containing protein
MDSRNGASGASPVASDGDAAPSDRFGHLFDLIGDAVVEIELVDTTPVVRTVNEAFETVFGYDREAVLGESLNEFIIPDAPDAQASAFDERTAAGKPNHAIVRRRTATGVRDFLYRGVPYERADGRQFGFAIYSDITEQRTYERHIHVIHRILRHNLRNELTVILGAAAMLDSETDDPAVRERVATIRRHARELAALGKEARTLERVLTGDRRTRSLDVVPFCRQACESVRENTAGEISLDVPDTLRVDGIPELQTAIEGVVENAVVHNTGDPSVRVEARWEPKRIVVEVTDDGPGIPESERTAVFDRGEDITQLQHGSGLGLWLARCAVEVCDGRLEYERAEGLTTVRLILRPGNGESAESA